MPHALETQLFLMQACISSLQYCKCLRIEPVGWAAIFVGHKMAHTSLLLLYDMYRHVRQTGDRLKAFGETGPLGQISSLPGRRDSFGIFKIMFMKDFIVSGFKLGAVGRSQVAFRYDKSTMGTKSLHRRSSQQLIQNCRMSLLRFRFD